MAQDNGIIDGRNIGGLNLYVNPLLKKESDLIRAVNVDSYPYGGKTKRSGYTTYLGTADGSAVQSLFSWRKEDGTTLFTYRASGSSLYYSVQGTGAWTLAGNGTISPGATVDSEVLGNTLFVCDGVGSTRHTTNGTSFTNTTLAPVATSLQQYQRRIYAAGTSSTLFYSTTNDGTNWATSGTSDSSSFTIPGAGKLLSIFKESDRLIAAKTSGALFKWDGYSLLDMSTQAGPTSAKSIISLENSTFFVNRYGHYFYNGGQPQLLSNAVEREFYNAAGSGVAGGTFDVMAAGGYRFDNYMSLGTITDDFTTETLDNAILKYNYQKNEYLNYSFANFPNSYHTFKDATNIEQFIFGDNTGQVYQVAGTATTDNGSAIAAYMEFVVYGKQPHLFKDWNYYWFFFNPGNEAKIQVAFADTYNRKSLQWIDVQDCSSGVAEGKFPSGARSKFLFIRVYESSLNNPFTFYGFVVDYQSLQI